MLVGVASESARVTGIIADAPLDAVRDAFACSQELAALASQTRICAVITPGAVGIVRMPPKKSPASDGTVLNVAGAPKLCSTVEFRTTPGAQYRSAFHPLPNRAKPLASMTGAFQPKPAFAKLMVP